MRIERQQAQGPGETTVTRHYGITVTGTPEELAQLRDSVERGIYALAEGYHPEATTDARTILGWIVAQLPTRSDLAAGDF